MPPLSVRQLCSYSYSVKFVAQWTKTVCPRAHWMLSKQNSYNMWLASEMSSRAHILNVRAPAVALFWVVVERFRSRAQLEEGGHGWRTIPGPFPLWPLLPDQSWSEELSTICTSNHDVLSKHMGPSDDGLNLLKLWKGSKKKNPSFNVFWPHILLQQCESNQCNHTMEYYCAFKGNSFWYDPHNGWWILRALR